MQVSLISGVMELHNHDIIRESSLSYKLESESPCLGSVPNRCFNFPLHLRMVHNSYNQFRQFFPFRRYVAGMF